MTRRERHMRIVESFGRDLARRRLDRYTTQTLLTMLSDEGVEKLTRALLSDLAFSKKLNEQNRKLRNSRAA